VFLKAPNKADNWIFSLAPVDSLCLEEEEKLVEESADVIVITHSMVAMKSNRYTRA
jgi:hypothetical protein